MQESGYCLLRAYLLQVAVCPYLSHLNLISLAYPYEKCSPSYTKIGGRKPDMAGGNKTPFYTPFNIQNQLDNNEIKDV